VQEVELIQANPGYAHVKLPDGREQTVSVRDLAPAPDPENDSTMNEPALPEESSLQDDLHLATPKQPIQTVTSDIQLEEHKSPQKNLESTSRQCDKQ